MPDDSQREPLVTAGAARAASAPARTASRPASGAAQTAATQTVPTKPPASSSGGSTSASARPDGATGRPVTKQRPVQRPAAKRPTPGVPRKVRLTVARVDPWSVMKQAFLLSVAIGIATVVMAGVLWTVLDGMGVFTRVNGMLAEILGNSAFDLLDFVGFARVISFSTVVAVVNVVLLTAISTLAGFLYNIASSLVGGLHLTLTDD